MSTLTIQLPDSIRAEVEALALRDGISADQFMATAAAEKVSALRTLAFLQEEAAQGREEDWDFVPHVWLGQWVSPVAYRSNLKGVIGFPEVIPFWNIEKA